MEILGQITSDTVFASYIKKYISEYRPQTIVESGTWKGMGSTMRIIEAITNNGLDSLFISLEINFEFYKIALNNLRDYTNKCILLYGRVVEVSDIINFIRQNELSHEQTGWAQEDLLNTARCSNVMTLIPKKIDFLLLDGGEFSTYAEWKLLGSRSSIIGLDDVRCLKCKKIVEELMNDENYEQLTTNSEKNGFAFFKRKDI